MKKDTKDPEQNNIINFFSKTAWTSNNYNKIIRLSPELDGISMLYNNNLKSEGLYEIKILCWALYSTGEVEALVPWLEELQICRLINDPLHGQWRGYFNTKQNSFFYESPYHKVDELRAASCFFDENITTDDIVQEIPDNIGTHAMYSDDCFATISLAPVVSWRLLASGDFVAMIADESKITDTPVLQGDQCLITAKNRPNFKYFFHHTIANKIKAGDKDIISVFKNINKQYNAQ